MTLSLPSSKEWLLQLPSVSLLDSTDNNNNNNDNDNDTNNDNNNGLLTDPLGGC